MAEIAILMRGLERSIYPGNKRGRSISEPEKLSVYGENVSTWGEGVIRSRGLGLDIERQFVWGDNSEILKYYYSMVIIGNYPKGRLSFLGIRRNPTLTEFTEAASKLEGYSLSETRTDFAKFINKQNNLSVHLTQSGSRITLVVTQTAPVLSLDAVADQIIPYAASVFNNLSPTWKVNEQVIRQSVSIAKKRNQIIPGIENINS
ncbi:hypothetical protein A3F00_01180 [Candidatus Daviesbacteria bacterium RIFCSPHIGHO2_12_FULL_37_11]|uniref:Uncharacterized protein n=1 Tax=Candidatus Daviesbacteria bacterium RIFCSPHIGHO2_12_FULL_37_11 TaxID=1797777 RepID=A0A1F5KDS0_9BACT|nr:MAG: hypothetical protein A2111_02555 [Candidatus Daviesbacteria bacterium GWA1_38_6]OGE39086.1 MAG: hypothetical protein A3F00_01180 [Candidatus Daviesbacteria bacterium RIFCSPHIGHO2_12_FULL_37_11]OGE44801.1 MAG: hypothetical protein A3B39_03255 [Candidatus Daviesbacteria bacterium RIFCSPLOWO2_01_FULL_37_10]